MKLVWLTDLHLDLAREADIAGLCARVRDLEADALLVGGDTDTAYAVETRLDSLRARTGLPTYFVLGNHDYHHGSIVSVQSAFHVHRLSPGLTWLDRAGGVTLPDGTLLAGVGGWGDGGFGDLATTRRLHDATMIHDFAAARDGLFDLLARLGREDAARLEIALEAGGGPAARTVVLTHLPPFCEAAHHRGGLSDPEYQPFMVCRAVGEVLRRAAVLRPDSRLLVLCGHTHHPGEVYPTPNLRVVTGGAVRGQPSIQGIIDTASLTLTRLPGENIRLPG